MNGYGGRSTRGFLVVLEERIRAIEAIHVSDHGYCAGCGGEWVSQNEWPCLTLRTLLPEKYVKEDVMVGTVCRCSKGRPGLVTGQKKLPWGQSWVGIALDSGSWQWAARKPILIAYNLDQYLSIEKAL